MTGFRKTLDYNQLKRIPQPSGYTWTRMRSLIVFKPAGSRAATPQIIELCTSGRLHYPTRLTLTTCRNALVR